MQLDIKQIRIGQTDVWMGGRMDGRAGGRADAPSTSFLRTNPLRPTYVSSVSVKDNNLNAVSTIVPSSCFGFCVIKPWHKIEQFGAQKEHLFFCISNFPWIAQSCGVVKVQPSLFASFGLNHGHQSKRCNNCRRWWILLKKDVLAKLLEELVSCFHSGKISLYIWTDASWCRVLTRNAFTSTLFLGG